MAASTARDSVTARAWGLGMLLYFGAQLASRVWMSDALELDEAEQVLWTQQLAWGYGTQPPLYTWLQWALFQLFGVSVFSLALLKNLLLAGTYGFTFLAARALLPLPLALLSAAAMLLIPQIGWESQRDLTHSVICTTMAAATLWLTVRLLQRPHPAAYLALGLCAGLGVLGKYSFAAYALALLGALVLARETRALLHYRWLLAGVAVALAVLAPHGLWLLGHWGEATQGTLQKMDVATRLSWLAGVLRGLGSLGLAVLAFLTPLWIVLAALFVRPGWRQGTTSPTHAHIACGLLQRYAMVLLSLFVAMVLVAGVTQFKDRWMQPFLFMAPLAFFACAPQLAAHRHQRWLRRIVVGMALLLLVVLGLRVPFHGWRGQPDELNVPAAALAQALRAAGYAGQPIMAGDRVLAGALRLHFPHADVQVARPGALPPPAGRRPLLWIAAAQDPARLRELSAAGAASGETPREVQLPYRYARPGAVPQRWVYGLR